MTETFRYQDEELELHGQLARPNGPGNGRAVLVLHEADGLGPHVRRRCAMLAELGYVALAADCYGGGRVLEGDAIYAEMGALRQNPQLHRRRLRAGLDALAGIDGVDAQRLAAIGYCFGGLGALELARSGAPVRAVASFHGILATKEPAAAGTIRARILACHGARDPLVPPEEVAAFQEEMSASEADWQLIIYGRAAHAFAIEGVDAMGSPAFRYDASADRQSWAALQKFLDESFGCASGHPEPVSG